MAKTETPPKTDEQTATAEATKAAEKENQEAAKQAQNENTDEPQTESSASTRSGRRTPQPEGQTLPSGGGTELGGEADDYDDPVTATTFGQTEPTITRAEENEDKNSDFRNSQVAKNFRKLTGYKAADIMGANERTHVIVTTNGGKYQLNRKGNQVRHLQGPPIPKTFQDADLGDSYVDARTRTPFVGTAAAINASVHEQPAFTRGEQRNVANLTVAQAEAELEAARERAENAGTGE